MAENTLNNIPANDPLRAIIEEVWANLREASESRKETEKMFQEAAESRKETEKMFQELDKIVRRNSKQMGDLNRRFGELAEHLVAPNIHKRFNELGYHFDRCAPGGMKIYDERGNTKAEIDLLMENGTTIMVLEVKAKPTIKDIEHHIKRLEILRGSRSGLNDKRVIKGAIAGAIFGTAEKKATLEAGLYVVEQSGDTMKIDVPKDFIAREW